jgi:lipopolysaccharide transport system ATP-binding protein
MPEIALRVNQLSKSYRIAKSRSRSRYKTLQEEVAALPGRLLGKGNGGEETFWALDDLSFDVNEGEVLGIIGHNGAGKSTLLKILSRITEPTRGKAEVYGRVGALLEVGTGFHPELTGRENVFLNGAILGMRRAEIQRHFDEIVAFAEVEQFLDMPVKRYSSGMYMRLAFAVAAHLEPEVLLIDEVLAVGDSAFQKKCLGKMEQVAGEGRTVFFVSHDLQAISTLTRRTLLLDRGRLAFDGDTPTALRQYRDRAKGDSQGDYVNTETTNGIVRASVITSEPNKVHRFGEPLVFEFEFCFANKPKSGALSFQVVDEQARPVIHLWRFDSEEPWTRAGKVLMRCAAPRPHLYMGRYRLVIHLADSAGQEKLETIDQVCPFEVVMDGIPREYPWMPGTCTYLEDAEWKTA